MIPIKEMTDVLRVVKGVQDLQVDGWVRLKRGLYKDDIAKVLFTFRIVWHQCDYWLGLSLGHESR